MLISTANSIGNMKKYFFVIVVCALTGVGIYSCNKENIVNPTGGQLPTTYITIRDSAFEPAIVTKANGSSFTFLNNSSTDHTLISDDSLLIRSGLIKPDSFYYVKPDTSLGLLQVEINYHCIQHPTKRGKIILTP